MFVDEVKIDQTTNTCDKVIYPVFNNITIPKGYNACFFTIAHVRNQTSVIYDIKDKDGYFEGTCFELNNRLFNFNSNPKVWLKNNGVNIVSFIIYSNNVYIL